MTYIAICIEPILTRLVDGSLSTSPQDSHILNLRRRIGHRRRSRHLIPVSSKNVLGIWRFLLQSRCPCKLSCCTCLAVVFRFLAWASLLCSSSARSKPLPTSPQVCWSTHRSSLEGTKTIKSFPLHDSFCSVRCGRHQLP